MINKKAKLDSQDIAKLRDVLLSRRQELVGDVKRLEDDSLRKLQKESRGELSSVPYHMADLASDNYEQEFTLGLIENEDEELVEIAAALERIEHGEYGVCGMCEKPISKKRLTAIPYARFCIECKRKMEENKRSPRG